jgi:galactofuranose transport system ATP-binding protein
MHDLLQVKQVSKSFPGVKALTHVDFSLIEGEIHGLMGENGAGKSTLIKVITGFYRKDAGDVLFKGNRIDFTSPQEAVAGGISTVYQEINLIPMLSVAENIFIGRQPMKGIGGINWRELHRRAEEAIRRLELDIDVSLPLESYPVAIQQMVSIARALDISAHVLILDEPTSSLDTAEVAQLFGVLKKIKDEGIGIIFITHFIDQVFEITDRISVLRNGELVGEFRTKELSKIDLVTKMLGKELTKFSQDFQKHEVEELREEFVSARDVHKAGFMEPFDLTIHRGEVLGLAGLLGSGRTEIAKLMYGIEKAEGGEIRVKGEAIPIKNPKQATLQGFGFCPEDRKEVGIIPELSVRDNIILALQAKLGVFKHLGRKRCREIADELIRSLNIVTPNADFSVRNLSGGNQQKVILARWLAADPEFLILDEPTRGIDVGAKVEILRLILKLKNQGLAILFISSELEEVVRLSTRIAVLRDRRKLRELSGAEATVQTILHTIAED